MTELSLDSRRAQISSDLKSHMSNLGLSFITHFDRLRELVDLEAAISNHKDAVHLGSGPDPGCFLQHVL